METAVPFRYIAEVVAVQVSEQEEGETGRGHPVGDLPLPGCQGQKPGVFNIAWEKSRAKADRSVSAGQPTSVSSPGGLGGRARSERLASEVRVGVPKSEVRSQFLGPVGELALVTLGNRMGHCMGLRMGYSMSTILYFFLAYFI